MEAFVSFWDDDQIPILAETMKNWESVGLEPVGIKTTEDKYELFRRITADNMASSQFYILGDIGCFIGEAIDLGDLVMKLSSEFGLIGFGMEGETIKIPTGIRVCQKGIIEKWPPKLTSSYDQEHMNAVKYAGKKVGIWDEFVARRLHVSA